MEAVLKLLEYASLKNTDTVLDIGMGNGWITRAVARRVRRVVGTGFACASYGVNGAWVSQTGIAAVESAADQLPFADGSYTVVILSHVLEHAHNVGWALSETSRVLTAQGLLCVLVPPHEYVICGGHVSTGWSIGQLMYVLALHGFDTRNGHYARYGYNVCAFVRKDMRPMPALRHDFGDLRTLAADNRFPVPISKGDNNVEAFFGDLMALNWPWTDIFPRGGHTLKARLLHTFVPGWLRPSLGRVLQRISNALLSDSAQIERRLNPKVLRR
jgi:SAM-dependent methyltransferase